MPEDVKPYYNEFLEKCAASQYADRCQDNLPGLTSISYTKSMTLGYAGTCFFVEVWIQKFSHITLHERYKHAPNYTKKALIFHELAHCLMDLDHTEHPGIMAPSLTYEMEYRRNWEKWEHELFHGDQNVDIFPIIPFR